MSRLLDDLRESIANHSAIVIIGTGVSIAASDNAPAASWTGLLATGVDRCCEIAGLGRDWRTRVSAEVGSGDLDDLLSAAEKITSKLAGPHGGEYRRWLRETIGELRLARREVIDALADLGLPLATTNYDDLLEQATGQPAVTWQEGARVERVVRGDEPGVLQSATTSIR